MKRETLILTGLLSLLVLIITVVFLRTPAMKRLYENFASQEIPTTTVCPDGFNMYMYDNTAFCCRGTVNTDATTVTKSCVPPITNMEYSFCTLGSNSIVPNCSKLQGDLLKEKGAMVCPRSKPNFCSANRCCTSPVTADGTDCTDKTVGTFCQVGDPSNVFDTAKGGLQDCNYQRLKESDTCPANTGMADIAVTNGPLSGLTIYGCSTLSTTCYTPSLINALKGMGKDTSGLTAC